MNTYPLIKALLFQLPPEAAHKFALSALTLADKFKLIRPKTLVAPCNVMGIHFPNPIGLAAGLDKNGNHISPLAKMGFGFIEIGTVTPRPQSGNPKPRMFRLDSMNALINRMGFNNLGVDYLVEQVKNSNYKGILGINIGKNFNTPVEQALDDYLICLEKVYPFAHYVTINISSPNTQGLRNLQQSEYLGKLLKGLKEKQDELNCLHHHYVPLAIKIAPDLSSDEIKVIAESLIHFKIDAVIATNTTISREGVEHLPSANEQGGLSGKPLFEKSVSIIEQLYGLLGEKLPIIGCGGIAHPQDALRMLEAGAKLIQIYTGFIYEGPKLIENIVGTYRNSHFFKGDVHA